MKANNLAAAQFEMRERWGRLRKLSSRECAPVRKPYREEMLFAAELMEMAWMVLEGSTSGNVIKNLIGAKVMELRASAHLYESMKIGS